MKHRTSFATIAVVAIAALAVAGCGSSNKKSSSNSTGSTSSSSAYGGATTSTSASGGAATGGTAMVSTAKVSNKKITKPVLVNSKGFTLYDFEADKGGKSACNGPCAQVWPPLTGKPKAQGAAVASKLGTIKRNDGTSQVTYAGHPLYTYTADKKPGDAVGNDIKSFGASWYALLPTGENASG
jgi:predicted lipoprotein with Yx(FWY)xxD motif